MLIKKVTAVSFALLSVVTLVAQPKLIEEVKEEEGKVIIPYSKYELENGLTVILTEDHSDPICHVDVTYHVGSARETPGKSGFAHLFEHMLFQKSDHIKEDEFFNILGGVGAEVNGNTTYDRTKYFETLPSNYLETALWIEADRMGFFLDAVTKKSFEDQRDVVTKEKEQNQLDQPYGTVYEVWGQNLYPQQHPYSWPVIGYSDDLTKTTQEDLRNFYLRWYGPNNAVLTVAGDIDKEQTLKWIQKYFGGIKQCPPVRRDHQARVILPQDKYVSIEDQVSLPLTLMSFPTVPEYHRDEAALEILSDVIGRGNNSIFYKNFVKAEKAVQANSFNYFRELSGEFVVQVVSRPFEPFEETEKLIRSTLEEFETDILNGPDIEEKISIAKTVNKSQMYDMLGSIKNKAELLSEWEWKLGRKYNVQDWINQIEAVTKQDLINVYNKYIKNKKALILNVKPRRPVPGEKDFVKKSYNPYAGVEIPEDPEYNGLEYIKAEDDFDRSVRPKPGTPKPAVIPESYEKQLDNGIKLIATKTSEIPKVSFLFSMENRRLFENGKDYEPGIAVLTSELMNESTKNFSTEEISKELDKIGSQIHFWTDAEGTFAYVSTMEDQVDRTMELFKEKLMNPAFNEEDFKRVKNQLLDQIKNNNNRPQVLAQRAFLKLLNGETPMGEYPDGTYSSVDNIKLDDVEAFYNNYFSADRSSFVVVGKINESDVYSKTTFMNELPKKDIEFPTFDKFPKYEGPQIFIVDNFGTQSVVMVGHHAAKFDYNGTHFKSTMMNFPLGGSFSSRLNLKLREEDNITYGIRSGFRANERGGAFYVFASVEAPATDTAVSEIMEIIEAYRKDGITDEELEFTKSAFLLSDVLNYETMRDKARFLQDLVKYDLPKDYIKQQEDIINAMTKEEINALAKSEIRPEDMIILIVGNNYVLEDRLEALGYGKVREIDLSKMKIKEFKL